MRFVSFSDDHRTENQFILRYRYTTVVAYALVERCNNVVLFVRLPPLFLFFVRRSPQNYRPRPASCRSVRFPVFNNTTNIVDVLFPLHYYPRVSLRTCKRYYWHNRSKKKKNRCLYRIPVVNLRQPNGRFAQRMSCSIIIIIIFAILSLLPRFIRGTPQRRRVYDAYKPNIILLTLFSFFFADIVRCKTRFPK